MPSFLRPSWLMRCGDQGGSQTTLTFTFCTPGMVMAAEALLRREARPSEAQIREALAGNLCRCTGYVKIVESVHAAAVEAAAASGSAAERRP